MKLSAICAAVVLLLLLPLNMASAKEKPPVSGGFSPARSHVVAGAVLDLTLEFSSEINAANWTLELDIPDGLILLDGEKTHRATALEAGRKYTFSYKLKTSDTEEKQVWARLHYADMTRTGITLSAAFLAVINERPDKNNSELRQDKKGRNLRVIKIPSTK